MDKILETERLYLRKICPEDFPELCGILQNEAVMYAWEHTFTDDEVQAWITEGILRYSRDGFSYWAVVEKASSSLIGVAGVIKEEADGEEYIGIGYIFNDTHWHKGYAYESAAACVRYAFETLGVTCITAQIRPTNASSVRVAEKLGMTVLRPFIRRYRGKDVPHLLYGLRKEGS
jgi:Acetyltransferases, including N-acetylases of ribosomal proteins